MPLYEYKCHQCHKTFEVRQKFSDEPLSVHEECGGEAERLISIPALQFKGSGFYITDYGKGGKTGTNGGNGKSESKSESKSDSSSSSSSTESTTKTESVKTEAPKTETKPSA